MQPEELIWACLDEMRDSDGFFAVAGTVADVIDRRQAAPGCGNQQVPIR